MKKEKSCTAYKGMNQDMTCRDFQYEVGGEYEEKEAVLCEKGFHACEYPLNVFSFYPPNSSRYFQVEQSGDLATDTEKTVSKKSRSALKLESPAL